MRLVREGPANQRFAGHNRSVFGGQSSAEGSDRILLVETGDWMYPNYIALGYFLEAWRRRQPSVALAYSLPAPGETVSYVKRIVKRLARRQAVPRSLGIDRQLSLDSTSEMTATADGLFTVACEQLKTKDDVEQLTIDGVWIGDLVYDDFLAVKRQPTLAVDDIEFLDFLKAFIKFFVFFRSFFNSHNVAGVVVSHCVYRNALPLRIAAARGIPCFQVNLHAVYRLDSDRLFAYTEFVDYPEAFKALDEDTQRDGLLRARERLGLRLDGAVGVDMPYSTMSAFGDETPEKLIAESSRMKILVATHCFFDNPHCFGNGLFPDFLEWLNFLGRISNETEYDWYIKTHPDFLPGTMDIVQDFVKRFPQFVLLPHNSSHRQIVREGIGVALTVHGTIGSEYPMMGVPVINASVNNPHIAYSFNIHPRTREEYLNYLLDLDGALQSWSCNESDILEYYYMARLHYPESWLVPDFTSFLEGVGGYSKHFSPRIYGAWTKYWTPELHRSALAQLDVFLKSDDFLLASQH